MLKILLDCQKTKQIVKKMSKIRRLIQVGLAYDKNNDKTV